MKRGCWVIGGMAILALVLFGSPAAAAEKTGFVDIREVMVTSNAGKKAAEDFRK
ncbi:MAG: hypothetical protein IH628_01110, partial [Proteobacteria bacterium]|nr:hypothetical protein [Pseudomonadota bacterium]